MGAIRYGSRQFIRTEDGDIARETWRVTGTTDPFAVLSDDGLPRIGDELRINDVPRGIYCRSIEPAMMPNAETAWSVSVEYGPLRPILFFVGDTIRVRWSIGTTSYHAALSASGRAVGSVNYTNPDGTYPSDPADASGTDQDEAAELGYDRLVSTLEAELLMPRGTVWNPIAVANATTSVNSEAISIEGTIFPAGWLLFMGGTASPLSASPADKEVRYVVVAASTVLNASVPAYIEDTNVPYAGPNVLPIRYGTWPRYRLDTAEVTLPDGTKEKRKIRKLSGVSVFEAYPSTALSPFLVPS